MWTYFTDSDTDFTLETCEKYGFKLISMPYSVDAKTVYPYRDFEKFDSRGFYDMLRGGVLPTTSALSVEEYKMIFEPEFAAGKDIFYIHFSSAMSMTFGNMRSAVEELQQKYPGRRFVDFDTKGITIISYLMVKEMGDCLRAGMSVDDVVAQFKDEVDHYAQYFFADDLKFFRRSGRVSGIAATMGGLIGVRPIIYMDSDGKMMSIGKEKGRTKAMERLVNYVVEKGQDVEDHRIIIGHTDAPEFAAELESRLREKFGQDVEIEIIPTNPTAGSHCGPNGVGVAFHSKER